MSALRSIQPVTYDEYLRIEEETGLRHEYVDGWLYAMAGESRRHNDIALNIAFAFRGVARSQGCSTYSSGVKFQLRPGVTYYPDVMVTCDAADDDPLIVHQPCLVVELLSPGTARTDQGEKRLAYASCSSIQTYLLVAQDRRLVICHTRTGPGADDWQTTLHTDGEVPLACPELVLPIDVIYADIDLSTTTPAD